MNALRRAVVTLGIGAVTACAGMLGAPAPVAADEPATEGRRFSVHVENERLVEVVIAFSQVTEENFVLMERELADKRITIYAPTPVTRREARDLLIAALTMSGLQVEKKSAWYEIRRAY